MSSRTPSILLACLVGAHLAATSLGLDLVARPLALIAVLLAPGVSWVLALGSTRWRLGSLLYYSAVTTPVLLLGAGMLAGGQAEQGLLLLDILSLAALAWASFRPSMIDAPRRPSGAAWAALALCATVAAGTALSPAFRASYHGLLHSSIVYEILRGGIPPENPYFAGEPLHYYWGFHLIAALLVEALDIDPLAAFALLRCFTAAALPLAVARLGRRCAPRRLNAATAALAGMVGLNALGWLLLLPRSGEALRLWREAANPLSLLSLMTWGFNRRLAAGLTIVLNLSGFATGLALGLVAAEQAALAARGKGWKSLAAAALLIAAAVVVNPLGGGCGLLILAGIGLGSLWASRSKRWNPAALAGLGAGAAGFVAAVPYLLHIAGGETRTLAALAAPRLWQTGWVLGPLALLALPVLATAHRRGTLRRWWPLLLAAALPAAGGLLLSLPAQDDYYLLRAAALPLGLVAAAALRIRARRWRGPKLAAVLLFLLLPGAITSAAYLAAARRPLPVGAAERDLLLLPASRDETRAYTFLRDETPPDAVVLERFSESQLSFLPAQGADVPVFGQRAEYLGFNSGVGRRSGGMLIGGYRDLPRRREQLEALFAPGCKPRIAEEIRAGLSRPVYLLARTGRRGEDRGTAACFDASPSLSPVFGSHGVRIYRVGEMSPVHLGGSAGE